VFKNKYLQHHTEGSRLLGHSTTNITAFILIVRSCHTTPRNPIVPAEHAPIAIPFVELVTSVHTFYISLPCFASREQSLLGTYWAHLNFKAITTFVPSPPLFSQKDFCYPRLTWLINTPLLRRHLNSIVRPMSDILEPSTVRSSCCM
jgi:hypothetical protein